jgi:hypothetical protein
MVLLIFWILGAILVAPLGKGKRISWTGAFVISLLFSPVIGLIAALISKDVVYTKRCKFCSFTHNANDIYCPKCGQDSEGMTFEEVKLRYKK